MEVDFEKWFFKYKGLHVVMWTITAASTFLTYYSPQGSLLAQVCNAAAVAVSSTIPFYTTAYFLIPRFLYTKRYFAFIICMVVLIILTGSLMMVIVRSVDHIFDPSRAIIPTDSGTLRYALNIFMWTAMIASFGAGGLKIMSDSFRLRTKLQIVENEKISTELNFLRSQINPHFLFNAMNTIYFQIDKRNVFARESVEKLSEMLRYQLYDCTTDKIEISQELDYIRNYVAMQTLRLEKGSAISLEISPAIPSFKIAPLLILPIVENAFKHISHFKDPAANVIKIQLRHTDHHFEVDVFNTYDQLNGAKHLINSGGLGVQNLRRRLELLYPDRYELDIVKEERYFHTNLKVDYYD